MKTCPFCAGAIQDEETVCRHCGASVVVDDQWRAFCDGWRTLDEAQRSRAWLAMDAEQQARFQGAWRALGYDRLPGQDGRLGDDAGMRWLLPVGRSGWAIAAGYLGLISILMVPAPLALITGLLAIRDIRRNRHLHGMGRAVFGVVMGALGTIGLGAILVAVLFAGRPR